MKLPDLIHDIEAQFFRQAVERTDGNMAAAARLLGLQPAGFRKALRERHPGLIEDEAEES